MLFLPEEAWQNLLLLSSHQSCRNKLDSAQSRVSHSTFSTMKKNVNSFLEEGLEQFWSVLLLCMGNPPKGTLSGRDGPDHPDPSSDDWSDSL